MKFNQFFRYSAIVLLIIIEISLISLSDSIICPDSHRKCENDTTCCKLSSGVYGCCPLPDAICCSDGLHCCPNGTKCNDKEGTCDEHINQFRAISVKSTQLCPDKSESCDRNETCCKERSGAYGCCPYESGVCCSDGLHCCPHGSECDLIHKQCVHKSTQFNDLNAFYINERMKLVMKKDRDVTCPGGRYQCPDLNTCCQISEQEWGCCPLVNAVCCEDKIHCCPSNTKCSQTGCQSL